MLKGGRRDRVWLMESQKQTHPEASCGATRDSRDLEAAVCYFPAPENLGQQGPWEPVYTNSEPLGSQVNSSHGSSAIPTVALALKACRKTVSQLPKDLTSRPMRPTLPFPLPGEAKQFPPGWQRGCPSRGARLLLVSVIPIVKQYRSLLLFHKDTHIFYVCHTQRFSSMIVYLFLNYREILWGWSFTFLFNQINYVNHPCS